MKGVHARALDMFGELADMSPRSRGQRLSEIAHEDQALHAILEAMLRAHARSGEYLLDRSPFDVIQDVQAQIDPDLGPDNDDRIGARVGPWRIDRRIASGGMGTVYEAQRDDGHFRQRVALKVLRTGLATPQLTAAFHRERELLAQLDHPGIAGLVDGGIDADVGPWFAMRYVDGRNVDGWCDGRRADIRQRVALLVDAGRALAYAHAQGVVHGDIKPSNLLVEESGRVQLVDFGISGLIGDHGKNLAVSRDYAAPEQLRLGTCAVATDIYAFGVLIYRLLCGEWPMLRDFPLGTMLLDQGAEASPMNILLKGASAGLAERRGERTIAALAQRLAGDLSAIALRAVARRPEDRYFSVAALVDDLQCWLDRRPVSARPLGWLTRTGRWLSRHRATTAITTVLILALLAVAVSANRQHQHNLAEARASESISQLFASNLGVATISGLSATPFSSRLLLQKTERELRALPLADHPLLFARAMAALARSRAEIGDIGGANRLTDEAVRILGDDDDPTGSVIATRSAMLNLQGRHTAAAKLARVRLDGLDTCNRGQSFCPRITLLAELARAQWHMAQPRRAMRTVNAALARAEVLNNRELTAELLVMRGRFSGSLMQKKQAEADDRRAIALVDGVNPVLADDAREQLFGFLRQRQSPDVLDAAKQLLSSRTRTLGEAHPKTGWAWVYVGVVEHPGEAAEAIRKGLVVIEAAYGREHPEYAAALAEAMWHMPISQREKVALMEEAVEMLTRRVGPRSERALYARSRLGYLLLDMPGAQRTQADTDRGFALLDGVIRDLHASGLPAPWQRLKLAEGLVNFGPTSRLTEAKRLLDIAAEDARRYFSANDSYSMEAGVFRNKLLYRMGERARADRAFSEWIGANQRFIMAAKSDGGSVNDFIRAMTLFESMLYRALYAYEICDLSQAESQLRRAKALARRAFGADDHRVWLVENVRKGMQRRAALQISGDSGIIPPHVLAASNARHARCP